MSAVIFDAPAPTVYTATCPSCRRPRDRHLGAGYFMPIGGGCGCPEPAPGSVTGVYLVFSGWFDISADGTITTHFGVDEPEALAPFTPRWRSFLSRAGFCPDAVTTAVVGRA